MHAQSAYSDTAIVELAVRRIWIIAHDVIKVSAESLMFTIFTNYVPIAIIFVKIIVLSVVKLNIYCVICLPELHLISSNFQIPYNWKKWNI